MISYIKITHTNDFRLAAGQVAGLLSLSLKEAIAFWHKQFLPMHFTEAASQRYHYADRTRKYEERKARVKGHSRPLVWSGDAERQVRRAIALTSTATRASAKGRLYGPRHLFIRNPIEVDKTDEITQRIDAEEHAMTEEANRDFMSRFGGMTNPTTRTIR